MTARRDPNEAGPVVAARRTADPTATDDFTYAVIAQSPTPPSGGERRVGGRQRTRLRSGKIVDPAGQFLAECLIANRSATGGLLRLQGRCALPDAILLYDDQGGELLAASVIWRRDREIGIRFAPLERNERHRVLAEAMRRKYYAMRR